MCLVVHRSLEEHTLRSGVPGHSQGFSVTMTWQSWLIWHILHGPYSRIALRLIGLKKLKTVSRCFTFCVPALGGLLIKEQRLVFFIKKPTLGSFQSSVQSFFFKVQHVMRTARLTRCRPVETRLKCQAPQHGGLGLSGRQRKAAALKLL